LKVLLGAAQPVLPASVRFTRKDTPACAARFTRTLRRCVGHAREPAQYRRGPPSWGLVPPGSAFAPSHPLSPGVHFPSLPIWRPCWPAPVRHKPPGGPAPWPHLPFEQSAPIEWQLMLPPAPPMPSDRGSPPPARRSAPGSDCPLITFPHSKKKLAQTASTVSTASIVAAVSMVWTVGAHETVGFA
jgi:hypothetical protein